VLVGFHSGEALEGVISHPGERFHVHYANGDASRSGHVDAYAVRAKSVLSLPAR
jgi:alpha-acetolactate decarboxylase